MTDYTVYHFTKKEWLYESARALIMIVFTGMLFFGKPLGVVLLLPAGIFLIKERKEKKKQERMINLRSDFKEFITSFSSSIQAGYSIEQSIAVGIEDLRRIYPKENRAMIRELLWIQQQLKLQTSCDQLLVNLADRTGLEEIRSFSVVLEVGRKQGGNLVRITRRTTDHINQIIQVQMEMEQAIAGKIMEKKIMFLMPFFIVLYLRMTNASYMKVLFSTIPGHMIMSGCLILLWISNKWADCIVKMKV